jgi:hypothetical protein
VAESPAGSWLTRTWSRSSGPCARSPASWASGRRATRSSGCVKPGHEGLKGLTPTSRATPRPRGEPSHTRPGFVRMRREFGRRWTRRLSKQARPFGPRRMSAAAQIRPTQRAVGCRPSRPAGTAASVEEQRSRPVRSLLVPSERVRPHGGRTRFHAEGGWRPTTRAAVDRWVDRDEQRKCRCTRPYGRLAGAARPGPADGRTRSAGAGGRGVALR